MLEEEERKRRTCLVSCTVAYQYQNPIDIILVSKKDYVLILGPCLGKAGPQAHFVADTNSLFVWTFFGPSRTPPGFACCCGSQLSCLA